MTSRVFLYDSPILPVGFEFPRSYLAIARNPDPPDITPWEFLFRNMPLSLNYYGAMLQKYPDKPLIPFALVDDKSGLYNGGFVVLACFDGDDRSGNPKVYFHDYSSAKRVPWAERYSLENFLEWKKMADDESARFKAEVADEDD